MRKYFLRTCFLLVLCSNALALPIVNISAIDSSAAEAGQDPGSFTVTRTDDGSLGQALNVYFDFVLPPTAWDFDFSAGLGYAGQNSRFVTIPAGESSATVTITPIKDNLIEGLETVEFTLASVNTHTLGNPAEASIEITDDVAEVHISAIDPAAAEAGQDPGSFTVTRTDNGNKAVALNVYFDFVLPPTGWDFDFSAGLGYAGQNSRYVIIPAGESSATVTITPIKDNLIEGLETVEFTLASVNTHTLGNPAEASIEITDDVAEVHISAIDPAAAEAGQDPGSFTVTRTDNGNKAVALNVYFDFVLPPTGWDFDFSAGLGYAGQNSRYVIIPAGESSATVTITPIKDNLIEGLETVEFTLASVNTHTLGNPAEASIEITDDVAEVHISAIDPAAAEAGQDPGSFTVTRTDNGNKAVALNVYFDFVLPPTGWDFDFSAGLGYAGQNSRYVIIPAGESSATVTITPIKDNLIEGLETVEFTLASVSTHTLGNPAEASIEITDDVAEVHISAIDPAAAEAGQDPGSFTVTRTDNGNKAVALNVYFDFVLPPTGWDFDFSAGLGYAGQNSRYVIIPAGESSATVTITPIKDNNEEEGDEIVFFQLVDRNTHTLGTPTQAEITIADFVNLVFKNSFEDPP